LADATPLRGLLKETLLPRDLFGEQLLFPFLVVGTS
jgi:hypothetical protein